MFNRLNYQRVIPIKKDNRKIIQPLKRQTHIQIIHPPLVRVCQDDSRILTDLRPQWSCSGKDYKKSHASFPTFSSESEKTQGNLVTFE